MQRSLALLIVALALAACRGGGRTPDVHTGELSILADIEDGCVRLVLDQPADGAELFDLGLPADYAVDYGRKVVLDPDGAVLAGDGDRVTVTGPRVADDGPCEFGPLLQVSSLRRAER